MLWFDAHLDLACLAVCGRDMTRPVEGVVGPFAPGCVSLPDLNAAGVRFALGTIFIEQRSTGTPLEALTPEQYIEGDIDGASRRARAQLEVYRTWSEMGLVKLDLRECLRIDPGVGKISGGMGVAELQPESLASRASSVVDADNALHLGILIEGADSVRTPDELAWWVGHGAVACGLAWAKNSRYAMGNGVSPRERIGLTDLGRAMVRQMDALGVVHDLSHLSQRATDELLSLTGKPVIATHSNCRARLGGDLDGANQRHLADAAIAEVGRRRGVVGLNLFGLFLRREPPHTGGDRPTIDDALDHVEHVCAVMGRRDGVGLGSDMDGGFSRESMCVGITSPQELSRLAEGLAARGWSPSEVDGFTHLNWLRFWSEHASNA